MTQTPATVLKVFGAVLFAVLLGFTIWSVFLDPHGNDPLTPEQQQRADDLINRRSGVTVVEEAGADAGDASQYPFGLGRSH